MRPSIVRLLLPPFVIALVLTGCDDNPPRAEVALEPPASTAVPSNQLISSTLDDGAEQIPTDDPNPDPPVSEPEPDPKPPPPVERCDPNYDPCVPVASDVDCDGGSGNGPAYVAGPVRVVGTDRYGLDRDGDGIGCDR